MCTRCELAVIGEYKMYPITDLNAKSCFLLIYKQKRAFAFTSFQMLVELVPGQPLSSGQPSSFISKMGFSSVISSMRLLVIVQSCLKIRDRILIKDE